MASEARGTRGAREAETYRFSHMRQRCLVGNDSRSTYWGGARCDEAFRDGDQEEGVDHQGAGGGDMEQEGCSEAFLRRLTGQENLGLVHKLLLTAVDTSVTQVRVTHRIHNHLREQITIYII